MSLYLDIEYLKKLNPDLLKHLGGSKFGFRCPVCGDSKKSKIKSRGYADIHRHKTDVLFVYCHNCNFAGTLSYLLKTVNTSLFNDYRKAKIEEKIKQRPIDWEPLTLSEPKKINLKKEPLLEESELLQKVINIPEAVQYLKDRNIDEKFWPDIFYSKVYKSFINTIVGGKYAHPEYDTPRIVFPILSRNRELLGYQGRAIDQSEQVRYLTVKLIDSVTLCYGMEKLDDKKPVIFVEGIFDALSIDNGIAMLSSSLNLSFVSENFNLDSIWVFDNERRNKEILTNYLCIADMDSYGLFFWPGEEYKDLNEMRKTYSTEELMYIIQKNTVYGKFMKKMHLANWKVK